MITHAKALAVCNADPDAAATLIVELSRKLTLIEDRQGLLEAQNQRLSERVRELQQRLARNSRNSSKPPSSDGFKKPSPKSLRNRGQRKCGGQPGHTGHTLKMVAKPDHTKVHRVEQCECCQRSLADQRPDRLEKRQVHDLPPRGLIVTEHQGEVKRCACGHLNKAAFPEGVNAPAQYGHAVKAAAVYLKNYQ